MTLPIVSLSDGSKHTWDVRMRQDFEKSGYVARELKRVSEEVRRIIKEPLKSGLDYFEDAKHMKSPGLRVQKINGAISKFTKASNVDEPLAAMKAERLVGVCYDLLGEEDNALRWYKRAYKSGYFLDQRFEEAMDYGLGKLTVDLGLVFTFVGMPLIFYRMHKHEKKARGLASLRNEIYAVMRPLSDLLYSLDSTLSILKPSEEIKSINIEAEFDSSGSSGGYHWWQ